MLHTLARPPVGLSQRQALRLGALEGASSQAIMETISLWPLGARLCLLAYDLIDYDLGEDAAERGGHITSEDVVAAARRGEPMDFGVTAKGLKAIADCAKWAANVGEEIDGDEWPEALATSEELERLHPDACADKERS